MTVLRSVKVVKDWVRGVGLAGPVVLRGIEPISTSKNDYQNAGVGDEESS
jgi:hypothetical protein